MTKQEVIQKAYGNQYEKCNPDDNGWVYKKMISSHETNGMEHENFGFKDIDVEIKFTAQPGNHYWRQKSLSGINNNNGWIKIESEDDLPKENIQCWLKDEEFGIDIGYFSFDTKKWHVDNVQQFVTHYQIIQKPQSPIY